MGTNLGENKLVENEKELVENEPGGGFRDWMVGRELTDRCPGLNEWSGMRGTGYS